MILEETQSLRYDSTIGLSGIYKTIAVDDEYLESMNLKINQIVTYKNEPVLINFSDLNSSDMRHMSVYGKDFKLIDIAIDEINEFKAGLTFPKTQKEEIELAWAFYNNINNSKVLNNEFNILHSYLRAVFGNAIIQKYIDFHNDKRTIAELRTCMKDSIYLKLEDEIHHIESSKSTLSLRFDLHSIPQLYKLLDAEYDNKFKFTYEIQELTKKVKVMINDMEKYIGYTTFDDEHIIDIVKQSDYLSEYVSLIEKPALLRIVLEKLSEEKFKSYSEMIRHI